MIHVSNLVKEYPLSKKDRKIGEHEGNSVKAVNDISFTCEPGRIFSLLGPNGAGKTTTLRMIATIIRPTAGDITVCGSSVRTDPIAVRTKIGFLTGSTGLYDRQNAHEIVEYFGALNGMSKADIKSRKEALFSLLEIHPFAKKRMGQLSTGMKQRVSIARTMIHDPSVVIFDEPTSGLDVISASAIIELIRQCKAQGKTVIFSSHIMSEVDLLCDDLAILHRGKIIYNNSMESFRNEMQANSLTEEFIRRVTGDE